MTDVADRTGRKRDGFELPTRYLPGLERRDLPEPESLRRYLGVSVIHGPEERRISMVSNVGGPAGTEPYRLLYSVQPEVG